MPNFVSVLKIPCIEILSVHYNLRFTHLELLLFKAYDDGTPNKIFGICAFMHVCVFARLVEKSENPKTKSFFSCSLLRRRRRAVSGNARTWCVDVCVLYLMLCTRTYLCVFRSGNKIVIKNNTYRLYSVCSRTHTRFRMWLRDLE